jgi:hypothetical protein
VATDLVRPRYGSGSLADILPSALAALGVPGMADPLGLSGDVLAGVRRIAVLLVDGLGLRQVPLAAAAAPVLGELAAGRFGPALELTAGFPSTTPTSLVSLGTGAAPGAHGVLGFTVNVPGTARVLNHIDWWSDPEPGVWQPLATRFEQAVAAGVATTVVSQPGFDGTGLTSAAYRGAGYRGVADVDLLAVQMLDALGGSDPPALVYGYHADVDRAGHLFGVDSAPWREAVAQTGRALSRLIDGLPADAALLITADHGQLNVPEDGRFDIDTDPRLASGVRVVAGEPRVRYLHTLPGARPDVISAWRSVLGERAWVVEREEAVAAGWFGPVPPAHLQRVGDVVVACHDRYVVLASRREWPIVSRLVAYHGSYTADEMLIPLIVVRRRAS